MTRLVKQRFNSDCTIASTAMLTGLTWEEAYSLFPDIDFGEGTSFVTIAQGLRKIGFKTTHGIVFHKTELPKTPSMLCVPSKNNEGGYHAVFWSGKALYDPNKGRKGKKYYTTKNMPEIIREVLY